MFAPIRPSPIIPSCIDACPHVCSLDPRSQRPSRASQNVSRRLVTTSPWRASCRPAATSAPRCTRSARRSRSASTWKSPRACAALTTPNVYFCPGTGRSLRVVAGDLQEDAGVRARPCRPGRSSAGTAARSRGRSRPAWRRGHAMAHRLQRVLVLGVHRDVREQREVVARADATRDAPARYPSSDGAGRPRPSARRRSSGRRRA